MRTSRWTCAASLFLVAGIVGGGFLWAAERRAAEHRAAVAKERAAVADLRKVAAEAGIRLPSRLRVKEWFDEQRDLTHNKSWSFSSDEPLALEGLQARPLSDLDRGIDREMLQKQFPERRIQEVLQKRWGRGETIYWVLSAKDAGTWYTFFDWSSPAP